MKQSLEPDIFKSEITLTIDPHSNGQHTVTVVVVVWPILASFVSWTARYAFQDHEEL